MTSSIYFDPSYVGKLRVPQSAVEPAPFNERKFIARRGCGLYPLRGQPWHRHPQRHGGPRLRRGEPPTRS